VVCQCCGTDVEGESVCGYCGMVVFVDFDDEEDAGGEPRIAESYRTELLARITNIKLKQGLPKIRFENGRFLDDGLQEIIFAGSGEDCYEKIAWAPVNICKPQDERTKASLTVSYDCGGVPKEISFKIETIRTDDWWRLGVAIQKNMRLSAYLGDAEHHSRAEDLPILFVP